MITESAGSDFEPSDTYEWDSESVESVQQNKRRRASHDQGNRGAWMTFCECVCVRVRVVHVYSVLAFLVAREDQQYYSFCRIWTSWKESKDSKLHRFEHACTNIAHMWNYSPDMLDCLVFVCLQIPVWAIES